MWSKLKDSVKSNLQTLADSTQNAYNRLSAYPEEVLCTNKACGKIIPVPASVFYWKCTNGHSVSPTESKCTVPGCAAKKSSHTPTVACGACKTVVAVPTSNIVKGLKEGVRAAPGAIKEGAQRIAHEVQSLGKSPSIFPCSFCSSQLNAPTGPWVCQLHNCSTNNESEDLNCRQCKGNRYSLGVLCGVCGRSTPMPSTKMSAELSSSVATAINGSVKSINYITNNAYVECRNCHHPHYPSQEQMRKVQGQEPQLQGPHSAQDDDESHDPALRAELSAHVPPGVPSCEVMCGNCLRPFVFVLGDVVSRSQPRKSIVAPAAPILPGTTETACRTCRVAFTAISHRRVVCVRCGHGYCHSHAPYVREQAVHCLTCAQAYDDERGISPNARAPVAAVAPAAVPSYEQAVAPAAVPAAAAAAAPVAAGAAVEGEPAISLDDLPAVAGEDATGADLNLA